MNSYNTANAAYRAAGLPAAQAVSHGRDWFEVESFRLDLRAHGREAAAAGNTDDPFNWENRREGGFNPILANITQGVCDMGVGCEEYGVCYAAAHDAPERCGMPEQVRLPYTPDVAALQAQGTRLLGAGGLAAAKAGGTSERRYVMKYVPLPTPARPWAVVQVGTDKVMARFGNTKWAQLTADAWSEGMSPNTYGRAKAIDLTDYTLA